MRRSRRELEAALDVAEASVGRVRQWCTQALDQGTRTVDARMVLELTDPHSTAWSYAVKREEGLAAGEPPDPRTDPVTGCLPVTAD
jgi:hypothetical protein